jgi:drug/metabolite transporter (DMT)-like permease
MTLQKTRSVALPFGALVALAALWGYNWVVMKVGLQDSEPFTYSALRNLSGAVFILALAAATRRSLRPQAIGWTALFGLFQTAGSAGLAMWAVQVGGVGKVSFLTYTMPFWLLLIAWPALREPVRGLQWVAVALALPGLVFVLEPWKMRGLTSNLLAVGAGISWAVACLVVKLLRARRDIEPLPFIAWQGIFGSIPLILVAVLTAERLPHWDAGFVSALAFSAIPGNAVAWILWLYALEKLPVNTAGFGSLAVPVVGVLAAWLRLGEHPGAVSGLGMGLIVVALAVLTAREVRESRRFAAQQPAGKAVPSVAGASSR